MPEGRNAFRPFAGGEKCREEELFFATFRSLTIKNFPKTKVWREKREEVAVKNLLSLVCLAFLTGCASFSVVPKSVCESEQIWEAKAVRFDAERISESGNLSAAIVSVPESWIKNERGGTVSFGSNGILVVNRDTWRAKVFLEGSAMETSALLGPKNTLIVLFPGIHPDKARLARVFIFSGLGTSVLDSAGREYGGEKGFDACAFVAERERENASNSKPLLVANLSPGTQSGGDFLANLYSKFSVKKDFGGKTYLVSPVPNIERATNGVSSPDDYVVSNLNAFLTPGMGAASAVQAVISTGYGVMTATPQGPYREAKLTKKDSDSSIPTPERERVGDQ